ncbi:HTH_Tnp_Tc3_2 domain-containing protein [Trichonephila clavipes]|nr:HTH_Tnp_Tc3_2 domain-containing protein [Trichonephila clavipes]
MEYVMGSFFTKDELPQYCYSLYSLWGNPDKKRERIPKGSIMRFHFYLNASRRSGPNPTTGEWIPAFNTPTTPSLQIAIHSPYFLPSPYNDGSTFSGGRSYELRVLMCNNRIVMAQRKHSDDFLRGRNIGRLECGRTQLRNFESPRVSSPGFGNDSKMMVINRRSTASDLSRQLSSANGTTVSKQTEYRRSGHIGLYARRPVRCVPLTTTHCRLRLTWSREHALWTPQ